MWLMNEHMPVMQKMQLAVLTHADIKESMVHN